MNSRLVIYRASAGSGKTFTLAANYIALVLRNPGAYRRILAVTFTNKATGEMKERIVSQLYGIAHGLPSAEPYLGKVRELMAEAGWTENVLHRPLNEQTLRENAGRALTEILHNYSLFRVGTIDAFMLAILRGLARELDLGHGMDIMLDENKLMREGVVELIKGLNVHSPELDWIVDYMGAAIEEGKHWDVKERLTKFAENLHKEDYLLHADDIETALNENPDILKNLRKMLWQRVKQAKADVRVCVDAFFDMTERLGLGADDFNEKSNGPYPFFMKLRDDISPNLTKTILDFASGKKRWSHNKSTQGAIVDENSSQFCSLLNDTLRLYSRLTSATNTAKLVTANLYQLQLLGSIDATIRSSCRRDNRFLLADTCLMLMKMASGPDDSSFIYEKTGTETDHILIDEFQDTSGLQWANFRPLLQENAARGMQNLVVGDVKQSIYRWRGSNADIMGSRIGREMAGAQPRTETLGVNRRSKAPVVEFNNRFFRNLVNGLQVYFDQCETVDILRNYDDVVQTVDKRLEGQAGSVGIVTLEPQEGESKDDAMCRTTIEQVQKLIDAGVRQTDIAILTRRKSDIALLSDWLAKYGEEGNVVRLVSGEAFKLEASDGVRLLVSAMRWVLREDHVVALAETAIIYHRQVLCDNLSVADIMALANTHYGLPETFTACREELSAMSLCELSYRLYDVLEMSRMRGQSDWMQKFFDVIHSYSAETGGTLDEFLMEWDETLSETAIPSGKTDGITCMTIHKAKGLEFHTVVIPFCNWNFENLNNADVLWVGTDPDRYEGMPCLPITRSKEMMESDFTEQYKEETKHIWLDNLNLLYVAFTRARTNLVVIKEAPPVRFDVPRRVGAFIDIGCRGLDLEGTPAPSDDVEQAADSSTRDDYNPLLPVSQSMGVGFHAAPLRLPFRQSNSSRTYINRGDDSPLSEFIERGNLLHEAFARIGVAGDASRAVDSLFQQGVINAAQRDEISRTIDEALRQPAVAEWFSGKFELFNESTILTTENGEVKQYRPDRVMRSEGRTIVVDFKFGQSRDEHRRQVRAYMELLRQMGFEGVEGYLWYVLDQNIIAV